MGIAQAIAKLRKEQHLTQSQLGALLHLSNTTISNYETGVSTPEVDIVIKLARLFHVSVDYLLDYERERQTAQTVPLVSAFQMKNGMPCGMRVADYLKLPDTAAQDRIAVYARDNSMRCGGIEKSDLLLVALCSRLPNGATGLLVDRTGAWLCRRYYRTGSIITLTPHTDTQAFAPIVQNADRFSFSVIGKVVGVLKKFP